MFSFHKPKVYRSTAGCCICKAKSSSSRFTDSKKYETDFIQCFQLETPRRGEICNACVLLVKRFKRLPPGSNRHWGHVVDARTGPGLKSMTKFKKRKEEQEAGIKNTAASALSERFNKIFKKSKKKEKSYKKETSSIGGSSDSTDSQHSDDYDDTVFNKKFYNYQTRAQQQKRNQQVVIKQRRKRKNPCPTKNLSWPANHFNLFVDVVNSEQWRQRNTCCGIVYECAELQSIIVDASSFKPCNQHRPPSQAAVMEPEVPLITNVSESTPSIVVPSATPAPTTAPTVAIKKHQLFLKRHSEPTSVITSSSCDSTISSNLMEICNKHKTESMDMTEDGTFRRMGFIDEQPQPALSSANENEFRQKNLSDATEKFLSKLNPESIKSIKPVAHFNSPLSNINGDKVSTLKFKLANIIKCGTMGNDNSSDSGYEEVQDSAGKLMLSMPPPDVIQTL